MAIIEEVVRVLRSSVAGRRPSGRAPGEIYVNYADRVLGWIGASGSAVDIPYLHREKGGTVDDAVKVRGAVTAQQRDASLSAEFRLTNVGGNIVGGVMVDHTNGRAVAGKRRAADGVWEGRLLFDTADILLAGAGAATVGASVMSRDRGDARWLQKGVAQEITGDFKVTGNLRVTLATTFDGTLLVKGDTTLDGGLSLAGTLHAKNGRINLDSPSGSSAQVMLRNSSGGTNRGLLYAADDGSFVRLLKYLGSGSTDVYLELASGDIRMVSNSSTTPPTSNSLIDRARGDARYLMPGNTLRQALGDLGTGDVGTYAFASRTGSTSEGPGDTTSGSNLRYSNANANGFGMGGSLPGSWRCMGSTGSNSDNYHPVETTLWLRYA